MTRAVLALVSILVFASAADAGIDVNSATQTGDPWGLYDLGPLVVRVLPEDLARLSCAGAGATARPKFVVKACFIRGDEKNTKDTIIIPAEAGHHVGLPELLHELKHYVDRDFRD